MAELSAKSPAVVAYAQALLELAIADGQGQQIAGELQALVQIIAQEPDCKSFLVDPGISCAERWDVLQRIFAGRISPLLLNFLGVLNEKDRFALLGHIAQAYAAMLDKKQNVVRAQVTVAAELDQQQVEEVCRRVSEALGKTAVIEQKIDPAVIGGLVLRVEDQLMDVSVRAQLDALKKQLLASRGKQA